MHDFMTAFPWLIASMFYIEVGTLWLRLIMVTDTTEHSRALLGDIAGRNGPRAAFAATFVALSVIVGWPAFMIYGWIDARLGRD
jgi:hypothetical protein